MGTPEERFFKKVQKSDGCWEWIGAKDPNGYGNFKIGKKYVKTHRVSYLIHFGKIPKRLYVLHHCDNTSCVKPQHLFLGTQTDNMQDMMKKGRQADRKGENQSQAKLTWKEVIEIRNLYSTDKYTQKEIGKLYNSNPKNISSIIRNKSWKS